MDPAGVQDGAPAQHERHGGQEEQAGQAREEGDGDPAGQADGAPAAAVLMVGVNGTGKTTTCGKLARVLLAEDRTVLMGAADTFRANLTYAFAALKPAHAGPAARQWCGEIVCLDIGID